MTATVRPRRKLPRRLTPYVLAFYMAMFMGLLMSCVLVAINTGMGQGYALRVLTSYLVAMPVAFCSVILIRPLVLRLVAMTVDVPAPPKPKDM